MFKINSEGLTAKKQRMNANVTLSVIECLTNQGFEDQYLLPENRIPVYLAKYNLKPFISDKDALEILRRNPEITQTETKQ